MKDVASGLNSSNDAKSRKSNTEKIQKIFNTFGADKFKFGSEAIIN